MRENLNEPKEQKCKDAIYKALIEHTDDGDRVRDIYRAELEPYAHHPYPLNRVGNFARVTIEYLENWINLPRLTKELWEVSTVAESFREWGLNKNKFEHRWYAKDLVKKVLARIGSATYTPEWSNPAAPGQNEDVIGPWSGITRDANRL
ncbi:hypothetical protein ACFL0V_07190, partial [Nanoarchaeota archaeon]